MWVLGRVPYREYHPECLDAWHMGNSKEGGECRENKSCPRGNGSSAFTLN